MRTSMVYLILYFAALPYAIAQQESDSTAKSRLFRGSPALAYFENSTTNEIVEKTTNEQKVDALIELARTFQITSPDSVAKYALQALVKSRAIGYRSGEAQALWALGLSKRMSSNYDSSLIDFNSALMLADSLTMPGIRAEILMGMGGAYYYKGASENALTYFVRAAELFEILGMESSLAGAYSNLGMVMNAIGQNEKALFYYRNSLRYARQNSLLNIELPVLINLALYFDNLNQSDSALYYADACYQISKQNNLEFGVGRALLILPMIYAKLELYDQSLSSAREGIQLFSGVDEVKVRSMIYQEAIALNGLGKHQLALGKCEFLLEKLKDSDLQKERVYLLASEITAAMGNYKKALDYYKGFFEVYENVSIERQKDQLAELEVKYDTDKKSREISMLSDRARIQELTIQRQYFLLGGAFLLAIVAGLLIFLLGRQRNLRKDLKLLNLESRLLRNQMNPHFIFNALSAIQRFVIKNNPIEGASFIAKFGTLMRQFLEQSRRDYISLEGEINTLTNYLTIQQLRFENKFTFGIEVDPEIDISTTFIPPLLAQPFIENAIEHGIADRDQGQINISFLKQGEDLLLRVIDNGRGLSDLQRSGHDSLSTQITQDRLHLLRGKKGIPHLHIKNRVGDEDKILGVEVSMLLPVKDRR